jgi:non-ribosomal peptide synthetase component E (peptide arylation enzyme)
MNWSYVLKQHAESFPDKECLIGLGKRLTYRQLDQRVDSLAQGLIGLGPSWRMPEQKG